MTTMHQTEFQIKQLRAERTANMMEAVGVMIAALFFTAFLPNLLIRYVYAAQDLTATPAVLEYIPAAGFAIGALFFIFVAIMNVIRGKKIMKLEKDLMTMAMTADACCTDCANCSCDEHGNCQCGNCMPTRSSNSSEPASLGLMAEKLKQTNKRKVRRA